MPDDAYGAPLLVCEGEKTIRLRRLDAGSWKGPDARDELFIQSLAFEHPDCLPIDELDSAFCGAVPICKELRTPAGYLDALFATEEGRLIVVEAKLWRNPEARRKVVAQILDYAKELARWSYEDLQREVSRVVGRKGNALFEIVKERYPKLNEARFVDGVSRSLLRGRFLLLIVGDGIREGVGAITEFIEKVGTLEFTFGLVEMALFDAPGIGTLVQPRVLARTEIISRSVVSIRDGRVEIEEDLSEHEEDAEPSELSQWYETLWAEWLPELKLDDPEQPIAKGTRRGNVFFEMPPGMNQSWLSVFFLQSAGQVGVFLTFRRGPFAERAYEFLLGDREAIEREVTFPIEWKRAENQKFYISTYKTYDGLREPGYRKEIKGFLADVVNQYVNAFRPRLHRMLEDA